MIISIYHYSNGYFNAMEITIYHYSNGYINAMVILFTITLMAISMQW